MMRCTRADSASISTRPALSTFGDPGNVLMSGARPLEHLERPPSDGLARVPRLDLDALHLDGEVAAHVRGALPAARLAGPRGLAREPADASRRACRAGTRRRRRPRRGRACTRAP